MPPRARGWLLLLAGAAALTLLYALMPGKSGSNNGRTGRHGAGPPPETNQH